MTQEEYFEECRINYIRGCGFLEEDEEENDDE